MFCHIQLATQCFWCLNADFFPSTKRTVIRQVHPSYKKCDNYVVGIRHSSVGRVELKHLLSELQTSLVLVRASPAPKYFPSGTGRCINLFEWGVGRFATYLFATHTLSRPDLFAAYTFATCTRSLPDIFATCSFRYPDFKPE